MDQSGGFIHQDHILFTTNQSYGLAQLQGRLEILISCVLESAVGFFEPKIFSLPQETFGLINAFICLHS